MTDVGASLKAQRGESRGMVAQVDSNELHRIGLEQCQEKQRRKRAQTHGAEDRAAVPVRGQIRAR